MNEHCKVLVFLDGETVEILLRHPAGRALVRQREPVHGDTPLDWCCHGSRQVVEPRDYASIARMLLEAGAELEMLEASDDVERVLSGWGSGGEATVS